jgi:hypothetical protein
MYAKVPAIDGVPQVGRIRLVAGVSISPTEAVAIIDGPLQPGWVELTEEEYLAAGGVPGGRREFADTSSK